MNKSLFIKKISEKGLISQKVAHQCLDATLAVITDALSEGDNIILPGFGSFIVRATAARICRNPQTGETMTVSAKKTAALKPGKLLKQAIMKDIQPVAAPEPEPEPEPVKEPEKKAKPAPKKKEKKDEKKPAKKTKK